MSQRRYLFWKYLILWDWFQNKW